MGEENKCLFGFVSFASVTVNIAKGRGQTGVSPNLRGISPIYRDEEERRVKFGQRFAAPIITLQERKGLYPSMDSIEDNATTTIILPNL